MAEQDKVRYQNELAAYRSNSSETTSNTQKSVH